MFLFLFLYRRFIYVSYKNVALSRKSEFVANSLARKLRPKKRSTREHLRLDSVGIWHEIGQNVQVEA